MPAAHAWLLSPPQLSQLWTDCLLADKDEEHEDPAEEVEDVDGEEEVVEEEVFKVRSISDQNCMDSFKAPKDAEDEEKLCVKNLEDTNQN